VGARVQSTTVAFAIAAIEQHGCVAGDIGHGELVSLEELKELTRPG